MRNIVSMAESEVEKIRKGPWTLEEDTRLTSYVALHGKRRWDFVAKATGLNRSGRSCRLRWVNYLSPHLKSTDFTEEEQSLIVELHATWGNRWSRIAQRLPGRTDNSIKNYCRTRMKKFSCGIQYGCRVNFQPSILSSSLPTSSLESNKFSTQSIEEYPAQPCGTISPGAITIPFWDTLDGGQQETASWEEVAESHSTHLSYNVWVESLYAMTLCGFNGDDNRSCTLYNALSPMDFTNTQFYSDELWNMDAG